MKCSWIGTFTREMSKLGMYTRTWKGPTDDGIKGTWFALNDLEREVRIFVPNDQKKLNSKELAEWVRFDYLINLHITFFKGDITQEWIDKNQYLTDKEKETIVTKSKLVEEDIK